MRRVYGDRRSALLEAIARHCAGRLTPIPSAAGLHRAARFAASIKARTVVAQAAEAGIGIESLDRYAISGPAENGLAFGYGAIQVDRIDEAIRRLAQVIDRSIPERARRTGAVRSRR